MQKAEINITNLNVRQGPGFNYPVVKTCKVGTYDVLDMRDNFIRIGDYEWVNADYAIIKEVKEKPAKVEPKIENKVETKSKKSSIDLDSGSDE